jgi:Tol biopolymer transport system component
VSSLQGQALSPDGSRIAFCWAGKMRIVATSGGRVSNLTADDERDIGAPSWSPDGSSLTYLTFPSGKAVVAITRVGDRKSHTLRATTDRCVSPPVWSPDGAWIACGTNEKSVLLISPDGKQVKELTSPVEPRRTSFAMVWSRDSSTLYIASSVTGRGRLDALDVRSGTTRNTADYGPEVVFNMNSVFSLNGSLSGDSRSIATTVLHRKGDIWMIDGLSRPGRKLF